jgi:tryptophanyl-tRNA synthetase
MRFLSGIQSSGTPHLGNYFGAMAQHVALSATAVRPGTGPGDTAFFFIADYHALTSVQDRAMLRTHVRDLAATYVALGLDVERAVFFRQSDVPEVCELTWLLSTVTGMGLLERAHSYKDKVEKGIKSSVGLFTYPILMSADILAYDSNIVPVGQDQVQHIEMCQDMATHFNSLYKGEFLLRPEWKLSPTPRIPGTDGEKMSKSYGNTIPIFAEGKELKKVVNAIVTDSRPPEDPKDPDTLNLFQIAALFLTTEERTTWEASLRKGGVGYGALKAVIIDKMNEHFGAARERHRHLTTTSAGESELEGILQAGASIARACAQTTLNRCLDAVGIAARR